MKTGILSIADPGKGLWRDTEILIWALQASGLRWRTGHRQPPSIFCVDRYAQFYGKHAGSVTACSPKIHIPGAVKAGLHFGTWLKGLDAMICSEALLKDAFHLALKRGVRVIYVPNLDCANAPGGTAGWLNCLRDIEVEVWSKTLYGYRLLKKEGIKNHYIPWSVPDTVQRERYVRRGSPIRFLFIAGRGGIRNRRGLDLALTAFALARQQEQKITLTIHSIKPLRQYVPRALRDVDGLTVSEGLIPREHLGRFYSKADILLYSTRWDGFGLSLLEALHQGLPVLATNGPPMNELVEHEHNGLLVQAQKKGMTRLAPHFECSPEALAQAMLRAARDEMLLDRLTCPEPGEWIARQKHFCIRVQRLIYGGPEPRVAIFLKRPCSQGARRSEHYWNDALRRYGYSTSMYFYEDAARQLGKCLEGVFDFILVSKVPPTFIKQIRRHNSAPIILWHHDISDHSRGRWRWFQQVVPLCDLVAVPESGRGVFQGLPDHIFQLFPGAKVDGDRGPGRRPRRVWPDWSRNTIAFLGQVTPQRRCLLNELATHFKVVVYGEDSQSNLKTCEIRPAVWKEQAVNVIRNATLVLSSSMRNDYFYTSNRLFNSAGSGGCVLVQSFPGMKTLYPKDSTVAFAGVADMMAQAKKVARNRPLQLQLRMAAENHTWRHHTWVVRVGQLIERVNKLRSQDLQASEKAYLSLTLINYWNKRALQYGARAVGYYKWNKKQFLEISEKLWTELVRQIAVHQKPSDYHLLDYGCGSGRFLDRLEDLGFNVIGIDISRSMLELSMKRSRNGRYTLLQVESCKGLPLKSGSIHVLWICTVLQHIRDELYQDVIQELQRILAPKALIIMLENTHPNDMRISNAGHVVFRQPSEYVQSFPGVCEVTHLNIEGETHTLFAGRLHGR